MSLVTSCVVPNVYIIQQLLFIKYIHIRNYICIFIKMKFLLKQNDPLQKKQYNALFQCSINYTYKARSVNLQNKVCVFLNRKKNM